MQNLAKKKWGQHFLSDKNLLMKLVEIINPKKNDVFLEIGCGEGALTELLVNKVKKIIGIEIDSELVNFLKKKITNQNFDLINDDFLKVDLNKFFNTHKSIRIIGNLPYNISSKILFKIIGKIDLIDDCYFMLQKEVVERIISNSGSKNYSRLTVNVQSMCNVKKIIRIPPQVFVPKPKVDSSFIRLSNKKTYIDNNKKIEVLRKITKITFGKRRKILKNTLSSINKLKPPVDFSLRAEQLSVEEYILLTKWIIEKKIIL